MLHTQHHISRSYTKSSTDAALVAIDDAMAQLLWTRNFLTAQGMFLLTTTIYQDNKITILLAKNRKSSSRRSTRHLDIRYFFVTQNQERRSEAAFRPTDDMLGDFFTKPLQGSILYASKKGSLICPIAQAQQCTSTSVHRRVLGKEKICENPKMIRRRIRPIKTIIWQIKTRKGFMGLKQARRD